MSTPTPVSTPSAVPLSIGMSVAPTTRVDPAAWETLAATVLEEIMSDGIDPLLFADTMREMQFHDAAGATWAYDGMRWWQWDGSSAWTTGRPTGSLRPLGFTMELLVTPEPEEDNGHDDEEAQYAGEAYSATNLVPTGGLPAWPHPDASGPSSAQLAPGLDVMVVTWHEDGWAEVRCANDWTAWVDGRRLLPLP